MGWATYDVASGEEEYGLLNMKKIVSDNWVPQCHDIFAHWLTDMVDQQVQPDLLVVEVPLKDQRTVQTATWLQGLFAIAQLTAYRRELAFLGVANNTVKAFAGAKGKDKDAMVDFANTYRPDREIVDHNVADAVCQLDWLCEKYRLRAPPKLRLRLTA